MARGARPKVVYIDCHDLGDWLVKTWEAQKFMNYRSPYLCSERPTDVADARSHVSCSTDTNAEHTQRSRASTTLPAASLACFGQLH